MHDAFLNRSEIITVTLNPYQIVLCIPMRTVQIGGYKSGTPEYWLNLTENQAKEWDGNKAVEFYKKEWDLVRYFIRKGLKRINHD